jgi:hypothetical protein
VSLLSPLAAASAVNGLTGKNSGALIRSLGRQVNSRGSFQFAAPGQFFTARHSLSQAGDTPYRSTLLLSNLNVNSPAACLLVF